MDKLEKHIKNKLRNREISPSEEAWSKISETLEPVKKTSTKRNYWWAVAAGLIGFIVLSIGFFNAQNGLRTGKDTVVSSKENKKGETIEFQKEVPVVETNGKVPEEMVLEIPLHQEQLQQEEVVGNTIEVVQTEVIEDKEPIKEVKEVMDLAVANKLEEVLAQVNAMENNAITISDAEIDSLLMAAQRELLTEKAFQENGKVDAMALLNQVEMELYDDERNPLFIKLKEGFFKLRTAVADRNN